MSRADLSRTLMLVLASAALLAAGAVRGAAHRRVPRVDRRDEGKPARSLRGDQVVLQRRPGASAQRLRLLQQGPGLAARRVERPHEAAAITGLQGRQRARGYRRAEGGGRARLRGHLCAAADREVSDRSGRRVDHAQGAVLPRRDPGRGRARSGAKPAYRDGDTGRLDRLSLSGAAGGRPASAAWRRYRVGAKSAEHGRSNRRSRPRLSDTAGEDPRLARRFRRGERA